jgi:hypothetical protein
MFEDDTGTVVGSPEDWEYHWEHGVYDIDMYNAFPSAKVHFAFIDACYSANLDYLGQGAHPNDSLPLGLPYAFTHRVVTSVPSGYSGTAMSDDGYSYPDSFPQCYIGFPTGSAALDQNIPYEDGTEPWCDWVMLFFYYALNFDTSVNCALNAASDDIWLCDNFLDSYLTGSGFTAVWPMDLEAPWGQFEEGPYQQGPHSTLAVYGNGNIHLKSFQASHKVTWPYISGPTSGDDGVSYQFSAYSIDSQGHDVGYTFDWDDGSSYEWTGYHSNGEPVYINHTWTSPRKYDIRVKAQCQGIASCWSNPYTIYSG